MPAFFVHGVPETHRLWDPIIAGLERDDTIAIDLPGFGVAPPPGFTSTKEAYVDWLIERIAAVGEPVDLVGHDFGAVLTLRAVCLRPDLVRSWAGGGGQIDPDYHWHPLARIWQTPGEGERWFEHLDRDARAVGLAEGGITRAEANRIVRDMDATMAAAILPLYRSAITLGSDWHAALAGFRPPALVIHGRDDPAIPEVTARRLAADIDARTFLLLEAGHWFPLQSPRACVEALERHWGAEA